MTTSEMLDKIDSIGITTSSMVLTIGATHLAVDFDGAIYAYKGEPRQIKTSIGDDFKEWLPGRADGCATLLYCGSFGVEQINWRKRVYILP